MNDYDTIAKSFAITRKKHMMQKEISLILPYINDNTHVLDIGCGSGRLLEYASIQHYTGIDNSKELLNIARNTYPTKHFIEADMTDLHCIDTASKDIIILLASFHHLLNTTSQHQCMREIMRILKDNGRVYMTCWHLPDKYKWYNYRRLRYKNWTIPFGNERQKRVYRRVCMGDLYALCKHYNLAIELLGNTYHKDNTPANVILMAQKR